MRGMVPRNMAKGGDGGQHPICLAAVHCADTRHPPGSASHRRVEELLLPKIGDAAPADMLDENLGQFSGMLGARPVALPLARQRQPVIMLIPAAIMRWMATSCASTEVPPDASVITVTFQPSPAA